jgi:hypothetical protein
MRRIYLPVSRRERPKRRVSKWFAALGGLLAGVFLTGCAGVVSSTKSSTPQPLSPLQIVTTALPAATVNSAYTASLGASGGVQPYTWSMGSGNLPTGVSLNGSGTIAGTAANTGVFNLTLKLTDSSKPAQTAAASLRLQVNSAAVPTLQITIASLPSAAESSAYSTQLTATGGSGALHWSMTSGQLPSGIILNAASGMLSGTATQIGSFAFTAQVQDSESTPQTATKSLSLSVSAPSGGGTGGGSNSPAYYGPGLGADALSNLRLGPSGYVAAYRFRATHTGSMQALHFYLIVNKTGYSGGNGGEVEVDLETDDGSSAHNPSGQVLATYTITNPQAGPASGQDGYFPTVTLASPVAVTEGQLYHVVFSNPSAEPAVNFVSVDALYHDSPSTPVQPTLSDTDCAVLLMSTGAPWQELMTHTQILQVDYTDGTTAGNGYMEVWVGTPEMIGGTAAVREAFTNNSGANIAVTNVSVRVNRTAGTAALTVRLEQSDGTLIEQGSIASSSVPIASDPTWVTYTFSAVRTLLAGQGYNLVLEAPSGTKYTAYPVRKGVAYGFATNTFFNDGYAQFNPGSGWVGWTQWGATNRTDGDLQFYFTTTP